MTADNSNDVATADDLAKAERVIRTTNRQVQLLDKITKAYLPLGKAFLKHLLLNDVESDSTQRAIKGMVAFSAHFAKIHDALVTTSKPVPVGTVDALLATASGIQETVINLVGEYREAAQNMTRLVTANVPPEHPLSKKAARVFLRLESMK